MHCSFSCFCSNECTICSNHSSQPVWSSAHTIKVFEGVSLHVETRHSNVSMQKGVGVWNSYGSTVMRMWQNAVTGLVFMDVSIYSIIFMWYLCIRYLTLYGGIIPLFYIYVHKMGHTHMIPHTRCLAYQTLYPVYVQYFLLGHYAVFMLRKIIMQDLIDARKFAFWACSEWRPLPENHAKVFLACVLLAQNYCTIYLYVPSSYSTG